MLVASSNNRAVENVSAEFPAVQAVADNTVALRYLRTFSNELLGRDSWGLIAAVLGRGATTPRRIGTRMPRRLWPSRKGGTPSLTVS